MLHPSLSINALCTQSWSFGQDLVLWKDLGVRQVGLLSSKLDEDPAGKFAQLRDMGIQSSTVIVECFDLLDPDSWEKTRTKHVTYIDFVADTGGHSIYFTPGRTTGAAWQDVLEIFAAAVAPSVAYAKTRGGRMVRAYTPPIRINLLRRADIAPR